MYNYLDYEPYQFFVEPLRKQNVRVQRPTPSHVDCGLWQLHGGVLKEQHMCSEAHTQPHPTEGHHMSWGTLFTACITEVVTPHKINAGGRCVDGLY